MEYVFGDFAGKDYKVDWHWLVYDSKLFDEFDIDVLLQFWFNLVGWYVHEKIS